MEGQIEYYHDDLTRRSVGGLGGKPLHSCCYERNKDHLQLSRPHEESAGLKGLEMAGRDWVGRDRSNQDLMEGVGMGLDKQRKCP